MKNVFIVFIFSLLFMSCEENETNDNLPNYNVNLNLNLRNPEFISLRTPGGIAYAQGGIQGIIIYNVNGKTFKAFERACPHLDVNSCNAMTVKGSTRLLCPCDDSEFNILNGSPLSEGITSFAREYRATYNQATDMLRITN
ncbi:Rieske 2Fe-2S domain-containing protein [Aureivirga sp. CE67]|uniref:Rieske 2Fe-2S domain-containing protein n=1 Tax=Aureivirga sp. CE67 TaxID=1788983 RepID=UPI0018C954C0|nr:Rieske 2Fe-2S domain-containing protein [Aureivirga sp. CE67]